MNPRQLDDLLAAALKGVADVGAELGDGSHVGGQVVHLILHLSEVVLHLQTPHEQNPTHMDIRKLFVCLFVHVYIYSSHTL